MNIHERPYTQEMVMIHRVFRREFGLLPALIRQVQPGDWARVALLADALDDLLTGLHVHHTGEDALLWPKLLIRADMNGALIARMQTQHEQAAVRLESAQKLLEEWRNTGKPETGDRLADELTDLSAELGQHLTDEEAHILPLVAEHITVEEWAALGEHGLATMGRKKLLMTLGAILEDATPAERAYFLVKVPLPGRMVWHLIGRSRYRRMIRRRRMTAHPGRPGHLMAHLTHLPGESARIPKEG